MSAVSSPPPADAASFRAAMGSFASGVTVITTLDGQGQPVGFTATSLASVSLDPPLILFCLGRRSRVAPAFESARSFVVNILASTQADVSNAFAKDPSAWFAQGASAWTSGESGPLIAGRLAALECGVERVDPGGDHLIFLGRVRRTDWNEAAEPLLYFRGKYRGLA